MRQPTVFLRRSRRHSCTNIQYTKFRQQTLLAQESRIYFATLPILFLAQFQIQLQVLSWMIAMNHSR
ncbi:hypothetical protein BDI4_450021 [Burkholderia diffusa]|nr:hypothetical protein BDI4_450021 [Burkholderia diffusa]